MRKIIYLLATAIFLCFGGVSTAQIDPNDSQEFFDQGDAELEQNIQTLEDKPEQPSLEQKEQTLEQELQINADQEKDDVEEGVSGPVDHVSPDIEDVSGPNEDLDLDDNLPEQPENEEIKFKL